jgi:hypothetical protein
MYLYKKSVLGNTGTLNVTLKKNVLGGAGTHFSTFTTLPD